MSYRLGVDLGTTWTAAAIWEAGKASIFPLGQQRAAIPSVVLLREDGTVLTGEAALRRAISEPERVAREFKRRIGDTTPIIVAGTHYPAEALTARLLRAVVDQVSAQQGRPPEQVVVSHPANWGPYKLELLNDILRRANLDPGTCGLITEPEAAAISYAARERIAAGQNVCVYDLGGGTFDVAVLQRTATGFSILGRPDGIERLGGIDFDAAIYAHVTSVLGSHYHELDPEDPLTLSAIARLRQDCVEAKEALSADTDTTIPVLLPTYQTELRLTRSEFESLIRPPLQDTIETTRRAIASAGLDTGDIHHVLLVGGSSRIPLISQLVQRELHLPTTVDADPKHAIALGAATYHDALAPAPAAAAPAPVAAPVAAPVVVPSAPAPVVERDDPFSVPRTFRPGDLQIPAPAPAGAAPVIDPQRTTRTPGPVGPPSRPTPRVPLPATAPPAPATPTPPPTPPPAPAPPVPAPPVRALAPAAPVPAPTPGPAPPGKARPADVAGLTPPPKARPANVAGLTPPGSGRAQPGPAGPQPSSGPASFAPPGAPAPSPPAYTPPPSPPPGSGPAPAEAPRSPRPAPPPSVLTPPAGPGASGQPLISSKAGSRPASGPAPARPSAPGPAAGRPAATASSAPRSDGPSKAALALVVVVVALMLGFGAYLLLYTS